MINDLESRTAEDTNKKIRYNIGLLITFVVSLGGMIAVSNIDNKLWRYSISGWCLAVVASGIYGMYKNDKDKELIYKEDLYKFCDYFNRSIGRHFM